MIFDTDVLVWAMRRDAAAARIIDASEKRALSILSLMELLQGADSKRAAQQIRQSLWQLEFRVLGLSEAIGSRATTIIEQYALGHGIRAIDALIAATAIEAGEPLCTSNLKHFRPIRSLSVIAFRRLSAV